MHEREYIDLQDLPLPKELAVHHRSEGEGGLKRAKSGQARGSQWAVGVSGHDQQQFLPKLDSHRHGLGPLPSLISMSTWELRSRMALVLSRMTQVVSYTLQCWSRLNTIRSPRTVFANKHQLINHEYIAQRDS